jgi:putative membrane protein
MLTYQRTHSPHAQSIKPHQPILFSLGAIGLLLLYCSPLQSIGNPYLFCVRMLQHLLLAYAIPCLFLAGVPEWMLLENYYRYPGFYRQLARLAHPLVACLLFNGVLTLWHLPELYELSLRHSFFHYLEISLLLATALLMWLPLLSPLTSLQPSLARQMFYVLLQIIAQVPLFAMLTFSSGPIYPTHALAPRLLPLTAYGDQQLGGWMLKTLSACIFAAIFIGLFIRWNHTERAREKIENATAHENFRLAQQSPQRFG